MGCNQSKAIQLDSNAHFNEKNNRSKGGIKTAPTSPALSTASGRSSPNSIANVKITFPRDIIKISDPGRRLFALLRLTLKNAQEDNKSDDLIWTKIVKMCDKNSSSASHQDDETGDTPLHLACRILSTCGFAGDHNLNVVTPLEAIRVLIRCSADILPNGEGYIALHDVLRIKANKSDKKSKTNSKKVDKNKNNQMAEALIHQTQVINLLIAADFETSHDYLQRTDVVHDPEDGPATPLYHATASIPDDFFTGIGIEMGSKDQNAVAGVPPSVQFISAIHFPAPHMVASKNGPIGKNVSSQTTYNFDKPLALLYRRFSRQFDESEKFFPGDNSAPEIMAYRQQYKTAAMNTWKIILCLLDPMDNTNVMDKLKRRKSISDFYMVHAAVRIDCPPDLLRYVIETRPEEVRQTNERGRLPLHVAAAAKCLEYDASNDNDSPSSSTEFACSASKYHYKFVMDELLYSYPDGAASTDSDNKLPLQLAVHSGKSWIGGGTKSLHDVYPDAMTRVPVEEFPGIKSALSFSTNFGNDQDQDGEQPQTQMNVGTRGVEKEEHYDAIMMVQKSDANLGDIISAMWANEEDAGVQMLGCVAIANVADDILTSKSKSKASNICTIALTAVTTIVNAMKNHPNEPIVQEKACIALRLLAPSDNYREVSFAASGATASIVNAMQAHVSDAIVQEEACFALRQIVAWGGAERATVVASVSGFTALQNAIGSHADCMEVQREACLALEALTCFPDANLPGAGMGGGKGLQIAPLLEAARDNFPDECGDTVDVILSRLS